MSNTRLQYGRVRGTNQTYIETRPKDQRPSMGALPPQPHIETPPPTLRRVGNIRLCEHTSITQALLRNHPSFAHYQITTAGRKRGGKLIRHRYIVCAYCDHWIGPRKFVCRCETSCHAEWRDDTPAVIDG
jgi:hypothetical protein